MKVRIKICGLKREEEILAAAEEGADCVGLVLAPRSPRAISLDRARELALVAQRAGLEAVALVADAEPELVAALVDFDRIQFHGEESCEAMAASPQPTIRGFPWTPEALARWSDCPHVDWLLADGARGGSGQGFDHAEPAALRGGITKPFFLAGGLDPDNVAAAIERVRPFGVDVSSGVERTRGVKDAGLIRAFCRAVRGVS